MPQKNLIEIFPKLNQGNESENCCDTEESTTCCETVSTQDEELLQLKKQLKDHFAKTVNVHMYNYNIPMDRIMAQKKLKQLFQQKGFQHISETDILQFVTPAVVVDGELAFFAQPLEPRTVIKVVQDTISNQ